MFDGVDTETRQRLSQFVQGEATGAITLDEAINQLIDEIESDIPAMTPVCTCKCAAVAEDAPEAPPPPVTALSAAHDMRRSGEKWRKIAEHLGVTHGTATARVRTWCRKRGEPWPIPVERAGASVQREIDARR